MFVAITAVALTCLIASEPHPADAQATSSSATVKHLVVAAPTPLVPLAQELTDAFMKYDSAVTLRIEAVPAHMAVGLVATGAVDLLLLDGPLPDENQLAGGPHGERGLLGTPIAVDAVIFLVHPDNPLKSLTIEQAAGIITRRIKTWAQLDVELDPLAGHTHTPDCVLEHPKEAYIQLVLPQDRLSTWTVLAARVTHGKGVPRFPMIPDGGESLQDTDGNGPLAIRVGAVANLNRGRPLALRRDSSPEPIRPSPDHLADHAYPLTHYVYLYSAGQPQGHARDFVLFALGAAGQQIVRRSSCAVLPLAEMQAESD